MRKIELLSQENNILVTSLETMKQYKDRYNFMLDEKNTELENAQDEYDRTCRDLDSALFREQELTEQLSTLEKKYNKVQEKSND